MRSHVAAPSQSPSIDAETTVALESSIDSKSANFATEEVGTAIAFCRDVARREAANFYWSFRLLPRAERQAMCVLYAFMRHTDDLADSDAPAASREAQLKAWRLRVDEVLSNDSPSRVSNSGSTEWPGFPALAEVVGRFGIPRRYLHAVIDGMAYDLHPVRLRTEAEFETYCWHVASAVGLCCLHIWGYDSQNGRAEALAERLGLAFQRTNILRDVAEDYALNRIYLPADLLADYGVLEAELSEKSADAKLRRLVTDQSAKARSEYLAADELLPLISPRCRPMLRAISRIYASVLDAIAKQDNDVLKRRASVPKWRKIAIMIISIFA